MPSTRIIGRSFERIAESFLHEQGMETVTQNFHTRLGEIDLIMRDANYLVFVEVRYRRNTSFGPPSETITRVKQRRLRRAAEFFLNKTPLHEEEFCRFDFVGITGPVHSPQVHWIRNAIPG